MVRKLQEPQETEDWEKYRGRQSVPCCWEANAAKQRDWIARLKTFLADGSIEGSGTYPAYNGATVFAPDVRELAWAGFVWTGNFDTVGKQKKTTIFSAADTSRVFLSECPNCKIRLTDWEEEDYAPYVHLKLSPNCRHHQTNDGRQDGWIEALSEEEAKRIFDTPEKRGVTFAVANLLVVKKKVELGRLGFIMMPGSEDGAYLGLQCLCGCGRKFPRWNGRMCKARKLHDSKDDDDDPCSEASFCWSSSDSE